MINLHNIIPYLRYDAFKLTLKYHNRQNYFTLEESLLPVFLLPGYPHDPSRRVCDTCDLSACQRMKRIAIQEPKKSKSETEKPKKSKSEKKTRRFTVEPIDNPTVGRLEKAISAALIDPKRPENLPNTPLVFYCYDEDSNETHVAYWPATEEVGENLCNLILDDPAEAWTLVSLSTGSSRELATEELCNKLKVASLDEIGVIMLIDDDQPEQSNLLSVSYSELNVFLCTIHCSLQW